MEPIECHVKFKYDYRKNDHQVKINFDGETVFITLRLDGKFVSFSTTMEGAHLLGKALSELFMDAGA